VDRVWEPAGAIHPATSHPVDTVYLSNTYGPVMFHNKDGTEPKVIDFRSSQALLDRVKNNGEKIPSRPEGYFDSLSAALVRTDDLDWIDDGVGNQVKVLRINEETGFFHILIKAKAGQVNPPHTHLGPADFYVLEGGFDYRGGSARRAVGFMSRPARCTTPPRIGGPHLPGEACTARWPFSDRQGGIAGVLDWRSMKAMAEKAAKKKVS
jgi:hypothetical protein